MGWSCRRDQEDYGYDFDGTKEGANPMRDFEQGVNVQYQTVRRIDVKDLLGSGFNPLKNLCQIGAYKIFETT